MNGKKIMKKTGTASKMLTALLTYAMVFQPTLNSNAQNVVASGAASAPPCSSFSVDDVQAGGVIICSGKVTKKNTLGLYTFDKTKINGRFLKKGERLSNYTRPATTAELQAAGIIDFSASANGGGRGRGRIINDDGGDDGRGRGRGRGRVVYDDNGGDDGRGGPGDGRGRGRGRISSPQDDFDLLNQFCGDYEDLYQNSLAAKKDKEEQIAAINLGDLQKAERDAYNKMLNDCRDGCVDLATTPGSACSITDQKQLIEIFSKSDLVKIDAYLNGQSVVISSIEKKNSADPTLVCIAVLGKKGCLEQIMKDGGIKTNSGIKTCEASADWIAAKNALDDANKKIAQLKADLDAITGDVKSPNSCKVGSARDLDRSPWKTCYNSNNVSGSVCNLKCLEKNTTESCAQAVADAQMDIRSSPRTPYCPTCGQGGGGGGGGGVAECNAANNYCNGQGGGACLYGQCNNVSKAAQIISAIGGIGVPLGLGFMNMSMQNRSLNACISAYSQQVEVAKTVGLPPQPSMCGLAYGMGGMNGMFGMGGMGGMGGMYPGMMGMGGMGGMYPGMMGMGGMGGMYPGLNLYGGLNLGMGNMGMYPGMMGMGGMGGMGGMYNPMMGIYGGAMGSMQGNMMGVQQQMYNAQMQMQQMAAQNMVLQNSMMMGNMSGMGMYGMGGMGGMYGGGMGNYMYNPFGMYGGGGNGLNFGLNLGLNFGYSPYMNTGYSPYMYGGGIGGMYPGSYYYGQ